MAVTEFALSWSQSCGAVRSNNLSLVPADLCVTGGGFVVERGLDTAIFMSLFFDSRLDERVDDDSTEHPTGDKVFGKADNRGWWGAGLLRAVGLLGAAEEYGSRLWQFRRAKLTRRTLGKMISACEEALAWLVSSEIATKVDVSIRVVESGRADILIAVHRNQDAPVRFSFVWDSMEGLSRG